MAPKTKQQKRLRSTSSSSTSSSSSEPSFTLSPDSWPRFITIQSTSATPITSNPFLIAKTIQSIAGNLISVKRLRDGSLLLECNKMQQAANLLKINKFAEVQVRASPHRSLNTCRGIIRDRDRCLQSLSEDDIAFELDSQGVTAVKRFTINKNGETIKTNTYLLTFNTSKLPQHIKAGYNKLEVTLYIPNPLRCFNCQEFGHGSRNCKSSPACRRCSSKEHDSNSCGSPPYCRNCKGDHSPSSKDCPAWIRESKINRIKYEQNIPFSEARKLVVNNSPSTPLKISYSATVKTVSTRSVSCQTMNTWLERCNPLTDVYTDPPKKVLYPSNQVQKSTQVTSDTAKTTVCQSFPPQ